MVSEGRDKERRVCFSPRVRIQRGQGKAVNGVVNGTGMSVSQGRNYHTNHNVADLNEGHLEKALQVKGE